MPGFRGALPRAAFTEELTLRRRAAYPLLQGLTVHRHSRQLRGRRTCAPTISSPSLRPTEVEIDAPVPTFVSGANDIADASHASPQVDRALWPA